MGQKKGTVRIYACGGLGMNIGHKLEQQRGKAEAGFAQLEPVYIDTSESNVRSSISKENCFILEGLDGSGKIRKENAAAICEAVLPVLDKFPPKVCNIVLCSAGGGTGSVAGPYLVSELLDRGETVVVITVGSTVSTTDIKNSLSTVKSFEGVAQTRKAGLPMTYFQNGPDTPRPDVDADILDTLISYGLLFGGEHLELDSKDLSNWAGFHRNTSYNTGGLGSMTVLEAGDEFKSIGNVITVATIATEGNDPTLPLIPEVHYVGFMPADKESRVHERLPVHFVVADGMMAEVTANLNGTASTLKKSQQNRQKRVEILTSADKADAHGVVFDE